MITKKEKELNSLKKIKKYSERIKNIKKPNNELINDCKNSITLRFKNNKINYLDNDMPFKTAKKIFSVWNKNLKNKQKKIFLKELNKTERAILREYIEYKKSKSIDLWKINSQYFLKNDDVLLDDSSKEEIEGFKKLELTKIENLVLWFNIVSSSHFRNLKYEITNMIEKMMQDNQDKEINYDNLLKIKEKEIEESKKDFKKKRNHYKKLSNIINKELKNVPLNKKIKLTNELAIISKKTNSLITLSSSESKVLDLIIWLEEIKKKNIDIIILDDPFTIVENTYIWFIIDYLKRNLEKMNCQIIVLINNNSAINTFQKLFFKHIARKNNKDILIYSWKLDENFKVVSKKMNFIESALFKIYQEFNDKSISITLRLHSARKIMEYLSFSWNGHNEFSRLNIYKDNLLNIFGYKFNVSSLSWKLLNDSSHFNLTPLQEESGMKAINEFMNILKKIGFSPTKRSSNFSRNLY